MSYSKFSKNGEFRTLASLFTALWVMRDAGSAAGSSSARHRLAIHDPTVGELNDAIAVSGPLVVVRHLNDGGAVVVQFLQHVHDHFSLAGMQAAGGLVREDQLGLANHRARDGYQLLLPAGKLIGEERFFADNLEAIQSVRDHSFALGFLDVAIGKRQVQIFGDG